MPRDVAEGAAGVLRALADPLRLQIVSAVAAAPAGRLAAGEIASLTELAASTVSHHLRSLREAGVLVAQRSGTWVHYALAPGMDRVAGTLLDSLAAAAAGSAGGPDSDPDSGPGRLRDYGDEHALLNTDAVLRWVADRLAGRFAALEPALVTQVVRESYAALGRTARITQHLPLLAERFAAQRLEDISKVRAGVPSVGVPSVGVPLRRPQVLFVCVANAGRSQLAAALMRSYAGDAVVVRSAGSMPAEQVHATVQPFLRRLLAAQPDDVPYPKPLTDDAVRAADVVITMGCGDACPVLPGKRYEDWAVGDPALASPAGVQAIYDDIETRVRALAADLTSRVHTNPAHPNPAHPTGTEEKP